MPELWIPESEAQNMLRRAKQPDEEGLIYSAALESVLREYGVGTAELELARDDAGWMKLAIGESSGISDMNRTYAVRRARAYFARDPLSGQAVRIWTDFAFGKGISWNAKDEKTGKILREFWDAKANKPLLSNQTAISSLGPLNVTNCATRQFQRVFEHTSSVKRPAIQCSSRFRRL